MKQVIFNNNNRLKYKIIKINKIKKNLFLFIFVLSGLFKEIYFYFNLSLY